MNKLFPKIVSAVTAAAMTLFVSSSSLQTFVNEIDAHAAETDVILGDVNNDDRVDVFDLCLVKREIINPGTTSINLAAADVNIDGVVDVKDAIEIQDFLLCRTKGFTGSVKKTFSEIDRLEFSEQRRILHDFLDKLKEVEDDEIYEYFLELLYDNEDLPEELEYSRIFKKYGSSMEKKLDQSYVGVTLVTAHSSKGMEWPIVFNSVTNYDSSRLHRGRSSRIASEIEETLRLLFVSTTRARDTLYLTGVYVAYGSEKEGYTYNQFLNKLYGLLSIPYDPVDHEKEERKARKAAARKVAKKNTSSVNLSGQKKLF